MHSALQQLYFQGSYHNMPYRLWVILSMLAVLLVSCLGSPPVEEDRIRGRLLLWHPFEGREAEVLNEILDQYVTLHPEVTIIREFVPETEMSEQFLNRIESGLGPDMLINSYIRTPELIEAGVVQDLNDRNLDTSIFLPAAISQVRHRGKLYGLPLSLDTRMLCFNKEKVTRPPLTFQGLVAEAQSGHRVAVFSNFAATFWGVPALGGRLLDEEGRVVLDQGGLGEWFEVLKQARNEPNFIFNNNEDTIQEAFAAGDLAYYVCWSSEIPDLQAVLGQEKIGVAVLPVDGDKPGGPFLLTNALLFSRASANTNLALQLAAFLTNVQQQTKLALRTESQIPANSRVEIDARLSPVVAALVEQSKTATAIPLDHLPQALAAGITYGDLFYRLVLEGELDPHQAAEELTRKVNSEYDLE